MICVSFELIALWWERDEEGAVSERGSKGSDDEAEGGGGSEGRREEEEEEGWSRFVVPDSHSQPLVRHARRLAQLSRTCGFATWLHSNNKIKAATPRGSCSCFPSDTVFLVQRQRRDVGVRIRF